MTSFAGLSTRMRNSLQKKGHWPQSSAQFNIAVADHKAYRPTVTIYTDLPDTTPDAPKKRSKSPDETYRSMRQNVSAYAERPTSVHVRLKSKEVKREVSAKKPEQSHLERT